MIPITVGNIARAGWETRRAVGVGGPGLELEGRRLRIARRGAWLRGRCSLNSYLSATSSVAFEPVLCVAGSCVTNEF